MLEMKEIFTDEEFDALKKRAEEIYEGNVKNRTQNEEAYSKVKEITDAIFDTFERAHLYGKVVQMLTISKVNINVPVVELRTESKSSKGNPKYSHLTENLTQKVCSLMSEYWDEGVWMAIYELFNCFPHYSAGYSSLTDKKTLTVTFDD